MFSGWHASLGLSLWLAESNLLEEGNCLFSWAYPPGKDSLKQTIVGPECENRVWQLHNTNNRFSLKSLYIEWVLYSPLWRAAFSRVALQLRAQVGGVLGKMGQISSVCEGLEGRGVSCKHPPPHPLPNLHKQDGVGDGGWVRAFEQLVTLQYSQYSFQFTNFIFTFLVQLVLCFFPTLHSFSKTSH